jgi:hypothetical protein
MLAMAACALASDYRLEEREALHHTFSGDTTLDVDQVNGSTIVIGDGGNTIRVEGEKVVRADDAEQMALAKREVVLDINEKNGIAQLYVNGPFRDNNNHGSQDHGFHEHNYRHYEVAYNFTIHVPRAVALKLHSVNGTITTQDTAGNFDLHTVNGKLTMTDVAGSGTAQTVNGTETITFRENPKAESSFKTVNGSLDVAFQPGLSAEMRLKTVNGGIFTDFDATALASAMEKSEKNGMFVYRTKNDIRLRAGSGGPEMSFQTVNGSIKIRKQGAGK